MRYRNNRLILGLIAVLILTGVAATQANKDLVSAEQIGAQLAKQPVEFEENRGQFDKRVRYQARGSGYSLFLTADEAVYVLPMPKSEDEEKRRSGEAESQVDNSNSPRLAFALRMKIIGANSESLYRGEEVREHRTNYLKGDNPENWQTDVPNYSRVQMQEVYPGVSMVWHGKEDSATQYDFVVEPNGNADQIALEFDGAERIEIDAEGNLLIHTEAGTIKQTKPFSYQETDGERVEVESRFVLSEPPAAAGGLTRNPQISFSLGEYDRTKPLTIDPYSTYLGATLNDRIRSIAVDATGNVYVTGAAEFSSFPTTVGAFDTTPNGGDDAFVGKLNPTGTALIYSTLIGGSGNEGGRGIAVDSSGNTFVTGDTDSTNYPTTAGAFDTTYNGSGFGLDDVFVTKLNAAGSGLIYSTFIGGSGFEISNSIAIDSSGSAVLTGYTDGATYPTTAGAFDTTHNGLDDAFMSKLNVAGSALLYSTFIGSSNREYGNGIAVDSSGNALIVGETNSSAFPTTAGAFDQIYNGAYDGFVTSISFPATAANVAIGGRVTVGKNGLARARVTLTDTSGETRSVLTSSFGYYRFDDLTAGETYIVSVNHKRYIFAPQVVSAIEDLTELNFMAEP